MSLADMPAVSIPMALSRCSNVIPGRCGMTFDMDFQRLFSSFCAYDKKLSDCVLCDPRGSSVLLCTYCIFMKVKIYDDIMAQCTKTSKIMLSKDGHNCSMRKRFSESDLLTKTRRKSLLNFFFSVYVYIFQLYAMDICRSFVYNL